jgi:hypothetical protein
LKKASEENPQERVIFDNGRNNFFAIFVGAKQAADPSGSGTIDSIIISIIVPAPSLTPDSHRDCRRARDRDVFNRIGPE